MKREQRKEANRAEKDYRFWHQERRVLSFAADEKERSGKRVGGEAGERLLRGADTMRKLAQEAQDKMNEAKARHKELTGIEPMLF